MKARWLILVTFVGACNGRIMSKAGEEMPAGGAGAQVGGATGTPGIGAGGQSVEPGTGRAGRLVRRMSANQIRATLVELTGFAYTGEAYVRDPSSAVGYSNKPDADLLQVHAQALGTPDYDLTVRESLDPGMSFVKFVEDAARSVCGKAAALEVTQGKPQTPPRLLVVARATDGLPAGEPAIRANVVVLARRFWGAQKERADPEVDALVDVFRAAATTPPWTTPGGIKRPAGGVADGWRAVCIALATDPQFFVY